MPRHSREIGAHGCPRPMIEHGRRYRRESKALWLSDRGCARRGAWRRLASGAGRCASSDPSWYP
jgi:hypothetical protein